MTARPGSAPSRSCSRSVFGKKWRTNSQRDGSDVADALSRVVHEVRLQPSYVYESRELLTDSDWLNMATESMATTSLRGNTMKVAAPRVDATLHARWAVGERSLRDLTGTSGRGLGLHLLKS
jgi:hypothetical protein